MQHKAKTWWAHGGSWFLCVCSLGERMWRIWISRAVNLTSHRSCLGVTEFSERKRTYPTTFPVQLYFPHNIKLSVKSRNPKKKQAVCPATSELWPPFWTSGGEWLSKKQRSWHEKGKLQSWGWQAWNRPLIKHSWGCGGRPEVLHCCAAHGFQPTRKVFLTLKKTKVPNMISHPNRADRPESRVTDWKQEPCSNLAAWKRSWDKNASYTVVISDTSPINRTKHAKNTSKSALCVLSAFTMKGEEADEAFDAHGFTCCGRGCSLFVEPPQPLSQKRKHVVCSCSSDGFKGPLYGSASSQMKLLDVSLCSVRTSFSLFPHL